MTKKTPKPAAPKGATPTASIEAPKGDRIAKVLARAGVASRREAERMIEAGRVMVNDEVITSPALNVTNADRIMVDEEPLAEPEPARLWLYHKPTGLVTSAKDEKGRETVFDTLPEDLPRVMSVGRLDLNSEGLLLLTNDGELKRKLELPSTGWTRKYRVRVKGRPNDDVVAPVRKGITVDGERFQPMGISIDRQQGANAWLTVSLKEGKNREIRRAMEAIGLSVNRLLRVSYGPFQLGTLQAGEVEEIRARVLRDQLGLEADRKTPIRKRAGQPAVKPAGKPVGKSGPKPFKGQGKSEEGPSRKPFGKPGARRVEADDDWGSKKGRGKPTGRGKPSGGRDAQRGPGASRKPKR